MAQQPALVKEPEFHQTREQPPRGRDTGVGGQAGWENARSIECKEIK